MHACDVLRERTAPAHAALERSDLILPATRDRARFASLVGALLSFIVAAERELARFAPPLARSGIDIATFAKSENLRVDADALSSPVVDQPHFELSSASQAAGALYVLEGSTLGGVLIANDLRAHIDFESRYYGCYGRDTASRWRQTRALLDRFAARDGVLDEMVAGAEATFVGLHRHLEAHVLTA